MRDSVVFAMAMSGVACASLTRRRTEGDDVCAGQRFVVATNHASIPLELVQDLDGTQLIGVIQPGATIRARDAGGDYYVRLLPGTLVSSVPQRDRWVLDSDRREELIRYVCTT